MTAFTAWTEDHVGLTNVFRFGIVPMFLFSATFYPLSSYGDWDWLVQFSPLYHGVAMVRSLNIGEWSWAFTGHAMVLVAMSVGGLTVTARRIERLLLQ